MTEPFDREWASSSASTLLTAPLRWRKPSIVRLPGDLFGDLAPDEQIDRMFAVMALAPQHTFQVLTKRSERMRDYFTKRQFLDTHPLEVRYDAIDAAMNAIAPAHWCKRELQDYSPEGLPLPNVWLGVSAERQQEADARIPDLLATPAAIRFVSLEPLLGPIDLEHIAAPDDAEKEGWTFSALTTGDYYTQPNERQLADDPVTWNSGDGPYRDHALDWVIVGGESGDGAMPMHPAWVRSLRDQCAAAGKLDRYFLKQWGLWGEPLLNGEKHLVSKDGRHVDDRQWEKALGFDYPVVMSRVGKKAAGRLLDGVEHNGMPEGAR